MISANNSRLSQEAIDELLARQSLPDDALSEGVGDGGFNVESKVHESGGGDLSSDGVTHQDLARRANALKAGPKSAMTGPTTSSDRSGTGEIAALIARIESIEKSLQRIDLLEQRLVAIKKEIASATTLDGLRRRITELESRARNTPAFNLYEKLTCAVCRTHGAAQVKTRCPNCGKEGWYGRRMPAEPDSNTAKPEDPPASRRARSAADRRPVTQVVPERRAA